MGGYHRRGTGTGHGRKFLIGFSLVARKPVSTAICHSQHQVSRFQGPGHKAEPHQKFATLPSHIFFLDTVKETCNNNNDPSLCIKKNFLQLHVLPVMLRRTLKGSTDKKMGVNTASNSLKCRKTNPNYSVRVVLIVSCMQRTIYCNWSLRPMLSKIVQRR